jgi:hypothetical protein
VTAKTYLNLVSCHHLVPDLAHLYNKSTIVGILLGELPSTFSRQSTHEPLTSTSAPPPWSAEADPPRWTTAWFCYGKSPSHCWSTSTTPPTIPLVSVATLIPPVRWRLGLCRRRGRERHEKGGEGGVFELRGTWQLGPDATVAMAATLDRHVFKIGRPNHLRG